MAVGYREIIFSIIYIILCQIHYSSQQMLLNICNNTIGNYSQNSKFQTNLNGLLSTVTSNIYSDSRYYYNKAGQGDDQVNAMALCRGDVGMDFCQNCVLNAAYNLTLIFCTNQKEAAVWYDKCVFRYSNNPIQGILTDVVFSIYNINQASDVITFSKGLNLLAGNLLDKTYTGFLVKFAQGEINVDAETTIYGYMQCTPDISNDDCKTCLNSTIIEVSSCCYKQVGALIVTGSCSFRYEISPFLFPPSPPPSPQPPVYPPPPPLPQPPLPSSTTTGKSSKSKTTIIIVSVILGLLVLTLSVCAFIIRGRQQKANAIHKQVQEVDNEDFEGATQYDFALIKAATNDFSTANMLGRGGFGEVHKGVLPDGKVIAVKRLSTTSGQGETEFRNEVKLLAKLQHNCLVKLLGFCLEQTERLLVYEFMENMSLDKFLFSPEFRSKLDWEVRHRIINSIAKGLLYLHEDSRLMIIHRDLKAGNILLDRGMNAKIADFGMARLFVLDEDELVTKRIAGTFGYMAPEYAMHGLFSVKSDVYSYGILLLEIISGKKNYSSQTENRLEDLPIYAYKTWKYGKSLDLIDSMLMADSDSLENMERCIHIALLCVQENAGNRPTMAAVVLMLQSLTLTLPKPSEPGFFSNTEMIFPNWSSFVDFQPESSSSSSQSKPILLHAPRSDSSLNVNSYSHTHF